jgi:hypothetical protein
MCRSSSLTIYDEETTAFCGIRFFNSHIPFHAHPAWSGMSDGPKTRPEGIHPVQTRSGLGGVMSALEERRRSIERRCGRRADIDATRNPRGARHDRVSRG